MDKENEKTKEQGMSETAKNILFFLVIGLIISLCFTGSFIYKHGNPLHFSEARANKGDAIWIYTNYKGKSVHDATYDLSYCLAYANGGEDVVFSIATDHINKHEGVTQRTEDYTVSLEVYDEILKMLNEENFTQDKTSNSFIQTPLDPNGLDYPVLIVVSSNGKGVKYFYADSSAIVDKCEELDQQLSATE